MIDFKKCLLNIAIIHSKQRDFKHTINVASFHHQVKQQYSGSRFGKVQ